MIEEATPAENGVRPALYVHVPLCESKCPYCGFFSRPVAGYDVRVLLQALLLELNRYDWSEPARTVYIGGGSPSCLPRDDLLHLLKEVTRRAGTGLEFTVEVNPGQVDESLLGQLKSLGVNRLSIGGQSFQDGELEFLGRRYKAEQIYVTVEQARTAGFTNINLDLIFAIPGSTVQSWQESLKQAIDLGVEHISAYSLTYEARTPLYARWEKGEVEKIDEETDRAMYETAIDRLTESGFLQYEISNFARRVSTADTAVARDTQVQYLGYECRHNLVYWANEPYIGIGPAAGSWWQGRRTTNISDIKMYIQAMEQGTSAIAECEIPTPEEIACETAVLMLRRIKGLDLQDFKDKTSFDTLELFTEPIESNKKLGFLEKDVNGIRLTRKGLSIADSVLCDFSSLDE